MSGITKLAKPIGFRPQPADIQAAAVWGIAAFSGAMYLVQPFDWIKKTFIDKPQTEEK